MTYEEAKRLGLEWTKGHDINLDGWRSVIAVLLQRIQIAETTNANLHEHIRELSKEVDALSMDLGIKNQDFRLPDQPQLADIAREVRTLDRRDVDAQ